MVGRPGVTDLSARHVTLLLNPTAGRGRAGRWAGRVVERFRAAGCEVDIVVGATASDALARAHASVAAGANTLVALGGDGLVHVGVQAVAGRPVTFGVIAAGTGNDFARALNLPRRNPFAAVDVILTGRTTAVDAGRIVAAAGADAAVGAGAGADRWFAGVLATGFDSQVNERANAMRGRAGRGRYTLAMVAELRAMRPSTYDLTVDGVRVELDAVLVAVGNTATYGGGMRIAPDAVPTDGRLDVTVVGAVSRAELLRVFPRVYTGSFVTHPAVQRLRGHTVQLAADGVVAYADGERVGPLPVTATVVSGALRVAVPDGRSP